MGSGGRFLAGLKANGEVWSWGRNVEGELGDNTVIGKSSPVLVVGGFYFVEQFVDQNVMSARALDGSSWMWGDNAYGQLGHNDANNTYSSPVLVVGNHIFSTTMTRGWVTIAKKSDGIPWMWGNNAYGQCGDNTAGNSRSSPVMVVGNHSFLKVDGSGQNGMGLKANGEVWMWGRNNWGQLGTGNMTDRSSPVLITGNHSFIDIDFSSVCAQCLKANGEVWGWGGNDIAQLGNGEQGNSYSSPVAVIGNHSFTFVSTSGDHSVALKADGSAWCWGSNVFDECGDGQGIPNYRTSPVAVVGGHSFIRTLAFYGSSAGLKADGSIWAWGSNQYGQLGDNTTDDQSSPVMVVGGHSFITLGAENILEIADIVLFQNLVWDGWTWGYQTPTGHTGAPWSDWKVKESAADARDSGDYGRLQLITGDEFVSNVKDLGDFGGAERLLKVTTDDYDVGAGDPTIQWRGHVDTPFLQDDDEIDGPTWEDYPSLGANKTWRYVQIKVSP